MTEKQQRIYNSNQLGKEGERAFQSLLDATLHCNSSREEDMTGWDFYVEWPNLPRDGSPIDCRPVPISVYVQTKARWEDNPAITMTVSSAERLAKEPKPSFVYAMAFDKDGNVSKAHVIHVRGEFLSLLLLKMRECSASEVEANKFEFTFSVKKYGEELPLKKFAFKRYVESLLSIGMQSYIFKKK